jgi:hypothetical protein
LCGEIGLLLTDFYNLTPRQFNNIVIGYDRKEEENLKTKMILNRDLEFAIVSPYLDKQSGIKTAQDYKKFSWEVETLELSEGRKFKTKAEIAAIWKAPEEVKK